MNEKKSKPLSYRTASEVRSELKKIADPGQALILSRFFKTGKGQYGEGDIFLGVKVPCQRSLARRAIALPPAETAFLLNDPAHECRLTGALILVEQFQRADEIGRASVYRFYLKHLEGINNWDLVDLSATKIMGEYLLTRKAERKILYRLVKSKNLWERRIAIISTMTFIKQRDFTDTLALAELLLDDRHDLIHKAVGWMLREIGKIELASEEEFLIKHYRTMPRTMLRYAIEKFPQRKKDFYLGR